MKKILYILLLLPFISDSQENKFCTYCIDTISGIFYLEDFSSSNPDLENELEYPFISRMNLLFPPNDTATLYNSGVIEYKSGNVCLLKLYQSKPEDYLKYISVEIEKPWFYNIKDYLAGEEIIYEEVSVGNNKIFYGKINVKLVLLYIGVCEFEIINYEGQIPKFQKKNVPLYYLIDILK